MHVDLDHAGIGRHLDVAEARIVRRRVAFQVDGLVAGGGDLLDGGHQRREILGVGDRRQEDAQMAVARLDGHRRAHRPPRPPPHRAPARRPAHAAAAAACLLAHRVDRAARAGNSSGSSSTSEASGRRRPIGESPGSRNRRSRLNTQRCVRQRRPFLPGLRARIGITKPAGVSSPCSNTRISRLRSPGSASLLSSGLMPTRQLLLGQHEVHGVLVGGHRRSRRQPELAGRAQRQSAPRRRPLPATSASPDRSGPGCCQSGSPSLRQ